MKWLPLTSLNVKLFLQLMVPLLWLSLSPGRTSGRAAQHRQDPLLQGREDVRGKDREVVLWIWGCDGRRHESGLGQTWMQARRGAWHRWARFRLWWIQGKLSAQPESISSVLEFTLTTQQKKILSSQQDSILVLFSLYYCSDLPFSLI